MPWQEAASEVRFERCPPLRPFRARPGKRLAPGWWWSATTGRLVHYGTAAMRLHMMLLDRDPRVSALACRPLELRWIEDGRARLHAPHLMIRLASGQGVLADCTARAQLSQAQRSLGMVVGQACRRVGWRYWVLGPVDPVYQRNVTWLAGYRHPRYRGADELARAVREVFAVRRALVEGVGRIGDPILVLPAVFHGLWSGNLSADLRAPMHERMLVWSGGVS
ncbi:TnsA-like heteromeric transposase endonuclease subunit [Streptomyces sp. NPDC001820]|uniref:TnsA-like heteromeric transposase endonuclease subunit n=1 Tax=Streptomyces sp. NPDC001820 TaxID=3364613 RepID=UPI0036992E63